MARWIKLRHAVYFLVAVALCASKTNGDDDATNALYTAVREDDVEDIRQALEDGANIDEHSTQFNNGGQSPLMFAALGGFTKALKELLAQGADPTIGEKDGYTPLHGAGFQGRPEAARILLAHPGVPNEMHPDGYLPLHRACWGVEERHTEAVRAFLEDGKHPHDAKSARGEMCIDLAQKSGNKRTLTFLRRFALLKKWTGDAAALTRPAGDAAETQDSGLSEKDQEATAANRTAASALPSNETGVPASALPSTDAGVPASTSEEETSPATEAPQEKEEL